MERWIRRRTDLPIWWAEYYPAPNDTSDMAQSALIASTLIRFSSQAAVALKWAPEGSSRIGNGNQASLWSDTTVENGGAPFPSFNVITGYLQCFPRGAKLKKLRIFGSGLSALASDNCVMMVNQTANDMQVSLGSRSIDLKAFETKFLH